MSADCRRQYNFADTFSTIAKAVSQVGWVCKFLWLKVSGSPNGNLPGLNSFKVRTPGVLEWTSPHKIPGLAQPTCQSSRSTNEKPGSLFSSSYSANWQFPANRVLECIVKVGGVAALSRQHSRADKSCEVVITGCLHGAYCFILDQPEWVPQIILNLPFLHSI